MKAHAQLEETYFHITETYTLDDFLPLAKAKCNNCGYFIIQLDSYNYYLDKGECPKCFSNTYFKINDGKKEMVN